MKQTKTVSKVLLTHGFLIIYYFKVSMSSNLKIKMNNVERYQVPFYPLFNPNGTWYRWD